MNNRTYFLLIIFILSILSSCRVYRPAIKPSAGVISAGDYIQRFKELAVDEMIRTGVPASITLAQGIIESDYGRSILARTANNHFGIKCHDDWKGLTLRHDDDRRNECFRKYSRPEDSFIDHSDFLRERQRYSFLFDLPVTDYKGWARGLKKAGYATNPDYANMLIRKIEEHNLYYYDLMYASAKSGGSGKPYVSEVPVKGKVEKNIASSEIGHTEVDAKKSVPVINDNFSVRIHIPRVMENNRSQYIVLKDGETIESIEKEFNVFRWEVLRFNDLRDDYNPVAGEVLYIQPKRNKAEKGKEKHIYTAGDSMHSISQKYGLRLKKLYDYNRMPDGEEGIIGQEIYLRREKPVR